MNDFNNCKITPNEKRYIIWKLQNLPKFQLYFCSWFVQRDSKVASLLFSSLFEAIFRAMDQVKTEREIEEVTAQINTSVEVLLSQSTHYFPPFMASIFVRFILINMTYF